jgi:hypothetical protein
MLTYLFLLAAIAAPELPTIDLTPAETEAIQEIVAILDQKEGALAVAPENPEITLTAVAQKAQPITIINSIEPSMLEYKHWTGKYSPEQFAITINGAETEIGKTVEIPANSKTVEIGYTYSFMNGMKSGGRKISYALNENITQANITFDWKNDWRVMIDNGKAIKEINA